MSAGIGPDMRRCWLCGKGRERIVQTNTTDELRVVALEWLPSMGVALRGWECSDCTVRLAKGPTVEDRRIYAAFKRRIERARKAKESAA